MLGISVSLLPVIIHHLLPNRNQSKNNILSETIPPSSSSREGTITTHRTPQYNNSSRGNFTQLLKKWPFSVGKSSTNILNKNIFIPFSSIWCWTLLNLALPKMAERWSQVIPGDPRCPRDGHWWRAKSWWIHRGPRSRRSRPRAPPAARWRRRRGPWESPRRWNRCRCARCLGWDDGMMATSPGKDVENPCWDDIFSGIHTKKMWILSRVL